MNSLTKSENTVEDKAENNQNIFMPKSFEQAERCADMIARSSLCPPAFKGKAGDVFIAMQMGSEIGLSPMQAIQNIAVINGRPCVYGDAALAVVRAHKHCESITEWIEGSFSQKNAVAYCSVKRRGQQEQIRSFSYEQASKAQLLTKAGVWQQYPERMLQMRARGFAIRDSFPDALRGINIAEEIEDFDIKPSNEPSNESSNKNRGISLLKNILDIKEEKIIPDIINEDTGKIKPQESELLVMIKNKMNSATSIEELIDAVDLTRELEEEEKAAAREVYKNKQKEFKE